LGVRAVHRGWRSRRGDGLTILSTSTIEEARRAMEEELLIKRGLRKFELRKWELREDWIDIQRRQVIGRRRP
jgi:hypothetical protein